MLPDVKQAVAEHHDSTRSPMRWGWYDTKPHTSSGGCFAGSANTIKLVNEKKLPYFFSIFHGDGAPLSFLALKDNKKFQEEMRSYTKPFNKFVGTERTKEWITFLLSDASPWKLLRPYLAESDVDFINAGGFIFDGTKGLPAKLLYNFVMAYRLPWEVPRAFGHWWELRKQMHPALALYIAMNFNLSAQAEDFNGPYDIIYPWSPLENTRYEAVGRFIDGLPKTLKMDEPATPPNVVPLWCTEDKNNIHDRYFQQFTETDKLMLWEIVDALNECAVSQRKAY